MIQVICTLLFPFVEPRINKMTPNSPHRHCLSAAKRYVSSRSVAQGQQVTTAHLMQYELFVLGGKGKVYTQSSNQCVVNRAHARNKGGAHVRREDYRD
jgi:hypothetical protein